MAKPRRMARPMSERIWSLAEFAHLNGICRATLTRAIQRGEGPRVVQISPHRIGVRDSDGAAWQAAREARA